MFDWRNVLERAFWTAVQTPAVVAALDAVGGENVDFRRLTAAAFLGFLASAVKTIGQERLSFLNGGGDG